MRTRPSRDPDLLRSILGTAPWVIDAGCEISVSTPPRLSASAHSLEPSEESLRGGQRAELERDHAAEARHLPLRQRVLRVGFQPGVVHGRDLPPPVEPGGDRPAARVVALHADRERLDPAQHQERIHRREDRADGVLEPSDPLRVLGTRRHHASADAVAVAVQVLRRRVHDDVGAQLDRLLEVRGS